MKKIWVYIYKYHPIYAGCYTIQCTWCYLQWHVCSEHNKRFNWQNKTRLCHCFLNKHSSHSYPTNKVEYKDNPLKKYYCIRYMKKTPGIYTWWEYCIPNQNFFKIQEKIVILPESKYFLWFFCSNKKRKRKRKRKK